MRIIEFDLERYGPFTGRKVKFRQGARLHVIYGPNEAGKSCSLSAITDLFFGIPRETPYSFIHEGKDLRIGGLIERQDGQRLEFRRRKGNKDTLIGPLDQPFGEHVLTPFFGGMSRQVFCSAFGLNTDQLRSGAAEMLTSDGDVGASLFAAASGLRGLTKLRLALDSDADLIFTARASKTRPFYLALARMTVARHAIKERELRATDWKALNQEIEEDATKLGDIKASRALKEAERARLSRLRRVAPMLRAIDEDCKHLVTLGAMPEVPPSFANALRRSLDELNATKDILARAEIAERTEAQALALITVDGELIAGAPDVQHLFRGTAAYANGLRDLPRIQAEADGYSGQLDDLSVRLGLADGAAIEAARPSDPMQVTVRGLIVRGRALTEDRDRKRKELSKERSALADMTRQIAERGVVIDPQPLEQKINALDPVLKEIGRYGEIEQEVHTESRDLGESARRLNPPVLDLETLATVPLPGTESISRYRKILEDLGADILREGHLAAEILKKLALVQASLSSLDSGSPVPSSEVISAKRNQRDNAWQLLRASLFGSIDGVPAERLAEAVTNFEGYGREADRLADQASTDAERVAAHSLQTDELSREHLRQTETNKRLSLLSSQHGEEIGKWNTIWQSTGIDPLSPSEMNAWLASIQALLVRRGKLRRLMDQLARIKSMVTDVQPELTEVARQSAFPHVPGVDAAILAAQIKIHLQSIRQRWNEARDLDTRVRDSGTRVERLGTEAAQAEHDHDDWLGCWKAEVRGIGISANATPDAAEAALAAWKEVPTAIMERNNRARRVSGMRRDISEFEKNAKKAVEQLAPDLLNTPFLSAVSLLNERLLAAINAETKKSDALKRLAQAKREREEADAEAQRRIQNLADLVQGLPGDQGLPEFLARVEERETISVRLAERRENLLSQADGHTEEDIRADLVGVDPDQIQAGLGILEEEAGQLERQSQQVFADHDRKQRDREGKEKGIGAEVAVQQRRNAEAELAGLAREWSILKLGSLMLGNVVDRYRANQHDPLIARAGEIFSDLTGGAFGGIAQEYDDNDVPRIVGKRVSGGAVPVTGMSDGTRDQLYLSLRLAYIENYATKVEPVPFICDDIFTTFDDDRTRHAIAVLGAVGKRVQTILFTHHMHVGEIARLELGADLDLIELA